MNPLGPSSVGLLVQYQRLQNASVVQIPLNLTGTSFDPDTIPDLVQLARVEVGLAWDNFIKGHCLDEEAALTAEWASTCRDEVSSLRSSLCIFSAAFPSFGVRYLDDPWDTLQDDVASQGYHVLTDWLSVNEQEDRNNLAPKVEAWAQRALAVLGARGQEHIAGNVQLPTWDEYARLAGPIDNDGNEVTADSAYQARYVDTQFWGAPALHTPIKGYNGYENLGLLFKAQLLAGLGENDQIWTGLVAETDLSENDHGWYSHFQSIQTLRTQLSLMWDSLRAYPEMLPLGQFPLTLAAHQSAGRWPSLWDTAGLANFVLPARNQTILRLLITNSAASRATLSQAGWPEAVTQLGTSLALGGFYQLGSDPDAMADLDGHMNDNVYVWDCLGRLSYISGQFVAYLKAVSEGDRAAVVAQRKARMNLLWKEFKDWALFNDLTRNLRELLLPYFPVGTTDPLSVPSVLPWSNLATIVLDTHGVDVLQLQPGIQVNATCVVLSTAGESDTFVVSVAHLPQHDESKRSFPKASFQIAFNHPVSLLEMPPDTQWILKGFYFDMTLIRDQLALALSNQLGMWAPQTRQTELYVIEDGASQANFLLHYQGVFCLEQRITRQVVEGTAQGEVQPFLFKMDTLGASWLFLAPETDIAIQIVSPPAASLSSEQRDWASDVLRRFETAMFAEEWLQTGQINAWDHWVDLDSWIAYFLHAELFKSVDAMRFSCYFYIQGDPPRIFFGPPWDFDMAAGNTGRATDSSGLVKRSNGWVHQYTKGLGKPCAALWFYRMLDVPAFKRGLTFRWQELRKGVLSNLAVVAMQDGLKNDLLSAARRNFDRWPTLGHLDMWPYPHAPVEDNFNGHHEALSAYLVQRMEWLDLWLPRVIPHRQLSEGSTCDRGEPEPVCPTGYPWDRHPHCEGVFWWLRFNWQSHPKFQAWGIDGSACSVQAYLHWENDTCPEVPSWNPNAAATCDNNGCLGPFDDWCSRTMDWLSRNWESSPIYAKRGVDGTRCSMQTYLHKYDGSCPPVRGGSDLTCQNQGCTSCPNCTLSPTTQFPTASPTVITSSPTTTSPFPIPSRSPSIVAMPSPPTPTTANPTPPPSLAPVASVPTLTPTLHISAPTSGPTGADAAASGSFSYLVAGGIGLFVVLIVILVGGSAYCVVRHRSKAKFTDTLIRQSTSSRSSQDRGSTDSIGSIDYLDIYRPPPATGAVNC